ncbi:MAG TPA: carbamoyltransferase C-terminal domain-containing protein [Gammaproteobacteria bacterium]|nr:carbamoyltransferase C-terminal domain-containing protein [Gammaproteobacteria bacterium]
MLILGISGGHDANWCFVRDGEILGAFEKERITKRKHDSGEVVSLIAKSLAYLGLTVDDIDLVATSEPVHRNTEPGFKKLSGEKYCYPDQWETHTIELFDRVYSCISVPHHLAHAAYARYTSPFESAGVITWDGGGDFYTEDAYCSTSISMWKGNKLEWLKRVENSDFGSLWFAYSNAIFGDGNAAGKLMGLAAYGTNHLVDNFRDRFCAPIRGILQGATTIKNCWPDYFSPPFIQPNIQWSDKAAQDIAFAIQLLTEESGLSIVDKFSTICSYRNLALSGGVALNGYLNTKIQISGLFDNVFVPPSVHDGGISVGCALFASHHVLEQPWKPSTAELALVGYSYQEKEVLAALSAGNYAYKKITLDDAVSVVAQAVIEGKIVAWYEGRSEHGPRALGNRSILALPHTKKSRETLNGKIKFRESYRPIAPVVLEQDSDSYFNMPWSSPYMMYIVESKIGIRDSIPSALHIDQTARVQTVSSKSSLGKIIEMIKDITGIGCVLNTSFNIKTPIVETPHDALSAYMESPIDMLYLQGYLVTKKG